MEPTRQPEASAGGEATPPDGGAPLREATWGCEHLRDRLGAERVAVWIFNEATGTISPAVANRAALFDSEVPYDRWMRTPLVDFPVLQQVIDEQRELVVEDGAADPRVPPEVVEDFGLSSARLLPLSAGTPVGVLSIEPAGRALTEDEQQIVQFLALNVGHSAARRQAEQQREQAELLLELTDVAARTESLGDTLAQVCQRLARYARTQRASLFLVEDGRLVARMAGYADGRAAPEQWERFRHASSPPPLSELVLETGRPQVIEDPTSPLLTGWWAQTFGVGSALGVPVGEAPDITGVLVLDDPAPRRYPLDLRRLVGAVGAQLDGLIARARAEHDRTWHLRTLAAVRELLQHAATTTSVTETGEILAEVAARAFDADRALFVRQGDPRIAEDPVLAAARAARAPRLVDAEDSPSGEAVAVLPLVSDGDLRGLVQVVGTGSRWGRHHVTMAEQLTLEVQLVVDNALLREKEQQRLSELAHHATHDPLTGLPNRALFEDRLDQALRQTFRTEHEVGLLFVDLDRFKRVNDRIGHALADEVLVEVARRLRRFTRDEDTVARFAGDEFVVLVPRVDGVADVEALAIRLRSGLSGSVQVGPAGTDVYVTLSMGIAAAGGEDVEARWLLRAADAAMYRAKRSGRSRDAVFDPTVDVLDDEALGLERDLHRALRRDELFLVHQPIVRLGDQHPVGFEVLLRWQHPELGLVAPLDFIPLAESTGLIHPIGRWVIEQACLQLAEWRRQCDNEQLFTSVNLSPMQVHDPRLVGHVEQALDDAGLPASALVLELTESSLVHEEEGVPALAALQRLGVRIAIDDFGIGYSALSYLHRFPIDIIKVDKSFVSQLGHGPRDSALARAVVAIARSLDIPAIAEGVEDLAQLGVLRELGSQMGQGFYFAAPMPAEEVPGWLEDQAGRSGAA